MSAASNIPEGFGFEPRAVFISSRNTVIPSFYVAAHHPRADAVVTSGGIPIEAGGERLTIGLVPPEYRFAVGPDVEGRCELYPQDKFANDHGLWWAEQIRLKKGPVESLHLRPIPHVRAFVSWKVDPADPSRLVPLGVPFEGQEKREADKLYSPSKDRFFTRDELEAETKAAAGVDAAVLAELVKTVQEMKAENQALRDRLELATEQIPGDAVLAAPCGKEVKKGGVAVHVTNCQAPECVEAKAVREATRIKRDRSTETER